jgi:hypothetical protein
LILQKFKLNGTQLWQYKIKTKEIQTLIVLSSDI